MPDQALNTVPLNTVPLNEPEDAGTPVVPDPTPDGAGASMVFLMDPAWNGAA